VLRCGVSFSTADEFREAFAWPGPTCFVPYPDEVEPGTPLDVDVTVGDARLALRGEVVGGDFDQHGNVGLSVALDTPSWDAVRELDVQLTLGASNPALFATTRMRPVTQPELPISDVAADAEPLLAQGTVIDERFRIERHLASGGMGHVYVAEHVRLKRRIALKLLRRALSADPQMWARFEREAQLVSKLESPHVVRVFDFGKTDDGTPFLALEFVDGPTLEAALAAGPFAPSRAVDVLVQVLEGLAEAHAAGMVHRDLKPANVVLGPRRGGGELAKILDFGIARLGDAAGGGDAARLTQVGLVVGTPAYLAPEQALADELDHRTDLYALGCVAYELLTGRPPFVANDLNKVVSQHLTAAPAPLEQLNPALAAERRLCDVVLKALAKERERRFQSAIEFRDALRAALGAAAVSAEPEEALPLAEVSPEAPGDIWPPPAAPGVRDEWQPPAPPATAAMPAVAPADDFFSSIGAPPLAASASSGSPMLAPLSAQLGQACVERLTRSVPEGEARGVVLRFEVLGPPPRSPAATACAVRALQVVAGFDGFVVGSDDEGWVVGFVAADGQATGRAVRALHVLRDAVAEEAARQRTPASTKALVAPARFPMRPDAAEKVRQALVPGRAGDAWCDASLAAAAAEVAELSGAPAGLCGIVAPRRRGFVAPDVTGRKTIFEVFERRLSSLLQGVAVPLVVRGPRGAGRTTLAQALIGSARKRGVAVALAQGGLTPRLPGEALVELVCSAVSVEFEERSSRLPRALEVLGLTDSARQAVLALCGIAPLPVRFTPGQAAHAARVVLRAAAGERPLVALFDGLDMMDDDSVEAFRAMAGRPVSRELVVGFAANGFAAERLAGLQSAELSPLTSAELFRVAGSLTQSIVGPRLQAWLAEYSSGQPAAVVDGVMWLEDRGALRSADGSVELAETVAPPPPEHRWTARLEVMPVELRAALTAAVCLGARFDPTQLVQACPRVTPGVLAKLQGSGFVQVLGSRQWRFRDAAALAAVARFADPTAVTVHQRRATALAERSKLDPAGVSPAELGRHLAALGDGANAAAAFRAELERALTIHDARRASDAWKGLADALSLLPPSDVQLRSRVEALARAAAQALAVEEVAAARRLSDEALSLGGSLTPSSAESTLVLARVLRAEGRRVKAAEVLAGAETLARGTPVAVLVLVEHGEAREQEGDLVGALRAFEAARPAAEAAAELARWHGEVNLGARVEARAATVLFGLRDAARAQQYLEAALTRWRQTGWPFAEARVLSTLGTVLAYQKQFTAAAKAYEAAASTAARCGDLLFQAKALLQQARALRKQQGDSAAVRGVAQEARKLALVLGWEQGRTDAEALVGGAAVPPAG
jgi:tRNA A-37 threonylcarbamoyl transferase component Bud32/tetratricopeptide (TPR) repeat protein